MSTPYRILIVEDEQKIRSGLRDFLLFQGHHVFEAENGSEASRQVADNRFDVILLDLMLPQISGETLCRQWRKDGIQTPIIMLTAKGQEKDRIAGLDIGADDYMTKPFSLEELRARIEAVLRRTDPKRTIGQTFAFGPWQVDREKLRLSCDNSHQEITQREADLISYFSAHPNRIIPRDELYEKVWREPMSEFGTRTVDMHIAKLRSKIESDTSEPKIIITIRGAGYQYILDTENTSPAEIK